MKSPKKHDILPISDLMRAIDLCQGDWLCQQPAEVRKEFKPYTGIRWAATVADGEEAVYMLWCVNERVNDHMFDLSTKHPDLIFRLLASCGLDQRLSHSWLPGARTRARSNAATTLLLELYPDASDAEIAGLLAQMTRDGFIRFLDECGLQPSDAKDVEKAKDALKSYDQMFPNQAKGKACK